jgi:hypothetical protein
MSTNSPLKQLITAQVQTRVEENPHHKNWSREHSLIYELGYVTGILITWAEENPQLAQRLKKKLLLK